MHKQEYSLVKNLDFLKLRLKFTNLRCRVSLNTTEQDRQCTYDMFVPPPLPQEPANISLEEGAF
jgi:hypothetical protein